MDDPHHDRDCKRQDPQRGGTVGARSERADQQVDGETRHQRGDQLLSVVEALEQLHQQPEATEQDQPGAEGQCPSTYQQEQGAHQDHRGDEDRSNPGHHGEVAGLHTRDVGRLHETNAGPVHVLEEESKLRRCHRRRQHRGQQWAETRRWIIVEPYGPQGPGENQQRSDQQQQMRRREQGIDRHLDPEDDVPEHVPDRAGHEYDDTGDRGPVTDRDRPGQRRRPGPISDHQPGEPEGHGQEPRVEDGMPRCEERLRGIEVAVGIPIHESAKGEPGAEDHRDKVFTPGGAMRSRVRSGRPAGRGSHVTTHSGAMRVRPRPTPGQTGPGDGWPNTWPGSGRSRSR